MRSLLRKSLTSFLIKSDQHRSLVRFTIAHEFGHLVLHRANIDMVRFTSEEDWRDFRMSLTDEPLGWFETQASEFAGRLLVPIDQLRNKIQNEFVICYR